MQHGGNYGLDFYYVLEEYEKTIIDRFYTAGWKENEKTIPLSIPKFAKKISIKKQSQNPLILLTINEMPRYVYRFQFIQMASSCLNESFAYLAEFLKYTSNRKKINIRSYPNTYEWDINDRLKEKYKDLKFDNLEKTFDVAIKNSDIFVSSCAHTTFLEALAANKPTIIFISKKVYKFRKDAQQYIDKLEEVKILHYSPKTAAMHLDSIYNDINNWWQKENVQKAKNNFVERYAKSNKNWADDWAKEFTKILL